MKGFEGMHLVYFKSWVNILKIRLACVSSGERGCYHYKSHAAIQEFTNIMEGYGWVNNADCDNLAIFVHYELEDIDQISYLDVC